MPVHGVLDVPRCLVDRAELVRLPRHRRTIVLGAIGRRQNVKSLTCLCSKVADFTVHCYDSRWWKYFPLVFIMVRNVIALDSWLLSGLRACLLCVLCPFLVLTLLLALFTGVGVPGRSAGDLLRVHVQAPPRARLADHQDAAWLPLRCLHTRRLVVRNGELSQPLSLRSCERSAALPSLG